MTLIYLMLINFLQNWIDALRVITKSFPLDILCINETFLDDSFPDHKFKIDGYRFPSFRRDRNKFGGGKAVYVKNGLILMRLNDFEINVSDTIFLELTISKKKKRFIMFPYRPPIESNKLTLFNNFFNTLKKAVNKYNNILITGDLNILVTGDSIDINNYLSEFINSFTLTDILISQTCFKTLNGTLLDIICTNKPKSFCKTSTVETGLSDCHKMIVTFLRASFKIIPSKNLVYRDYKHFNQNEFLHELDLEINKGKFYNSDKPYDDFYNLFKTITDKHAPIKQKRVRGNNAPFMTKELREAIMDRSRLRNKYLKYPSRENFVNTKKMKNK